MKRSEIYRKAAKYLFNRTKINGICCAINTTSPDEPDPYTKNVWKSYPELKRISAVGMRGDAGSYWFDGNDASDSQAARKHRGIALLFAAHMAEDAGN